jgi:hypothetical protein
MSRKRNVNQIFDPVLSVDISATNIDRLVYLLVANKPIRYGKEYSRIVYIGTTKTGIKRIAGSASKRIRQAVDERIVGLRRLDAFVVWARTKRGPQTKKGQKLWGILERALLIRFCDKHGERPRLNGTGHNMKEKGEFNVFRKVTIDKIINRYM